MNIKEIIDKLGTEVVLNEIIQWLPSDALNEICSDIERLYDFDIEEEF